MSWQMSGRVKLLRRGANGEEITGTQKFVLLVLADYHNDEDGYAWPSVATLADKCLCSVRTIQDALRHLRKVGLLRVVEIRGEKSRYYILPDTPEDPAGVQPDVVGGVQPDVVFEDVSFNEPTVSQPTETQRLPLPKPEKKEKSKKGRPQRSARSLNDFPESGPVPSMARIENITAPGHVEPKRPLNIRSGMNKFFKTKTGKSMGVPSADAGELITEAVEHYGQEKIWAAFELWIEKEKGIIAQFDFAYWGRFAKNIDVWIGDVETKQEAPASEDPNAGLALSEKGKKLLEKFS